MSEAQPNYTWRDAQRTLRPSAAEAADAWRALVVAEREQVERLPNRPRPEDFYAPVAESFRAEARRGGEPLLDYLLSLVQSDETWLDIGAGGGRYTLPIALLAARVFAIEPSQGMRSVLSASAREEGITNLEVFDERWPGPSEAPIADVAFISQVGYDIEEFGAFLDQMEAHARRLCVAVMFERSPIAEFAALWPDVHGEERILLPALPELLTLLFARGRRPAVHGLYLPPRTYASLDALHRAARRPLWVREGSAQDQRLGVAVKDIAKAVEEGFTLNSRERYLGVVTWRPEGSS
ncbi:MAG TPA: methyltransferase domain-containing protein [Dehalococcoidia bacterium]|nr:methyltransferase domain-containing protein [Dehalococcoidia bacterium]